MSDKLNKTLQILQYALLGISTILGVIFLFGLITVDTIIYWCYFLLVVAAVAAIGFAILNMIKNPKRAKTSLIGLGALAVVFVIAYALGGDEILPEYRGFISEPSASKQVSMGLIAFYILGIVAVGTAIFSEISRAFK